MRSADGENGFSMEVGPYVSFANRNGVSAVFSGEVSSWPGVDMVQITHDGALPALRNINAAWPLTYLILRKSHAVSHCPKRLGSFHISCLFLCHSVFVTNTTS